MSNLMIELRYRDIDPDSGLVSNDGLIALVDPAWSKAIKDLLERGYADEGGANRDFYMKAIPAPPTRPVPEKRAEPKPAPAKGAPEKKSIYPGPKENWGYSSDPRDLKF